MPSNQEMGLEPPTVPIVLCFEEGNSTVRVQARGGGGGILSKYAKQKILVLDIE